MSTEKDILGKADGLMRRHAGPGSETGAFPVLTDIIGEPEAAEPVEAAAPPAPAPAPIAEPEPEAPPAPDPSDLATDIFNRVMAEVEGRLAEELERRLTEHLVPQVHTAVASALGDLHQELANAIGDAVTRALENRSR